MTFIDAIVIALVLGAAWSGFRRGFVASMVALVAALGGAILAIRLAPLVMDWFDDSAAKVAVVVACLILGVGIGELAGTTLGRALTDRITWTPAKALDKGLGLVGHGLAILVITWIVAVPIASAPYPWLASAVRSSSVLGAVDEVMPSGMTVVSDRMRQMVDESGFPAILDPLAPSPTTEVAPPDPAVAALPDVITAGESVLKIRGRAPSCNRAIEGTGFVIGPQRMLTNAHVVAGTERVVVEQGEDLLEATVMHYDPQRDLAVLDVPGLDRAVLPWAGEELGSGTDVVAVGYPLDAGLTFSPGRIQTDFTLRGPDIYDSQTVTRGVYTVLADIRSGNSGGPLLDTTGQVVGVVFGAAIDRPDIGFILTEEEVASTVADGLVDAVPAGTGACTTS